MDEIVEQKNEKPIREANEAIVELVREQKAVLDEKKDAMAEFKTRLDDIQSRMDGQLRVLDDLLGGGSKQAELPFEKKAPADGSGDVIKAQDGAVHAGEEMFETAGRFEEAEVIPLLPEHRDESGSSVEFMTDGMEAEADDGTIPLDDSEIALLATDGNVELAAEHYCERTGASRQVADGEIKAWQAAQQESEVAQEEKKARRSRKAKG